MECDSSDCLSMMARPAWLNSTSRTDGKHQLILNGALNIPPSHFAVHFDTVSGIEAMPLMTAEAVFSLDSPSMGETHMR